MDGNNERSLREEHIRLWNECMFAYRPACVSRPMNHSFLDSREAKDRFDAMFNAPADSPFQERER